MEPCQPGNPGEGVVKTGDVVERPNRNVVDARVLDALVDKVSDDKGAPSTLQASSNSDLHFEKGISENQGKSEHTR